MSFHPSSRSAPVIAVVFTAGLGLGFVWQLGLIPFELNISAGGSLEAEQTPTATVELQYEDIEESAEPEPAWTAEDHGEPPVQEGTNWKSEVIAEVPASTPTPPPYIRSTRSGKEKTTASTKPLIQQTVYQEPEGPAAEPEPEPAPVLPKRVAEKSTPRKVEIDFTADRFAEIDAKQANGELLAAHKLLSKLYWNTQTPDEELQQRLDESAMKIFFSPQPHFIEPHVVQTGDQLRKIAGKYGLSWEYLAALNKTDPKRIREGQKMKVLKGPFAAIVNLHEFSLTIHLQGYYVKRYQVGIGKDGSSPLGKFTVLEKLENPQYTDPEGKVIEGDDPKNPLGERWIDLGNSYGIHGTIEPDSIGKAESRGCIRLKDADIIEVYNFLVKGSVVEIRE